MAPKATVNCIATPQARRRNCRTVSSHLNTLLHIPVDRFHPAIQVFQRQTRSHLGYTSLHDSRRQVHQPRNPADLRYIDALRRRDL